MKNRLIIIGAGGHGKVIADIALKNGYTDIAFCDDHVSGDWFGCPVLGKIKDIDNWNDGETDFIIAIGNNATRKTISEAVKVPWITLVHPSAQIGVGVEIGKGTVIMAGVILNADTKIGQHSIINSGAVIEHDNVIGDYVHVSPNASLGGTVSVGGETHIGIGAVVKNNIEISSKCTIGAGAVVVKDILRGGVYAGIPASPIQKK